MAAGRNAGAVSSGLVRLRDLRDASGAGTAGRSVALRGAVVRHREHPVFRGTREDRQLFRRELPAREGARRVRGPRRQLLGPAVALRDAWLRGARHRERVLAGVAVLAGVSVVSDPVRGPGLPHRSGGLSGAWVRLGAVAAAADGRGDVPGAARAVRRGGVRRVAVPKGAAVSRSDRGAGVLAWIIYEGAGRRHVFDSRVFA